MTKTILWTALVLVGGHLVLGVTLLAIEMTHGINDQDFSYSVALAFYYLNLPTIWLLRSGNSITSPVTSVLAVGIAQWAGLAFVIGTVSYISRAAFRAITGRATKTAESVAAHGPRVADAAGAAKRDLFG
jgi:hypothetical protein